MDKNKPRTWKSMMNMDIGRCLGQTEQNGIRMLCAKWDMEPSQVLTVALNNLFKQELPRDVRGILEDTGYINQRVGETINARAGGFGYDREENNIPQDKHWLIDRRYKECCEV